MHHIYTAMKARLEKLPVNTVLAYCATWGDNCGYLLAATTPGVTKDRYSDYSDVLHKAQSSFNSDDAEGVLPSLVNVYD